MIDIVTPAWEAGIAAESGANLCRLFHRASGREILRRPDSIETLHQYPERYGVPVLLPPNRIGGGRFNWRGREYVFPLNEPERGNHLHGLILGHPWRVEAVENDRATLALDFAAVPGFPHDFSLSMTYRFTPAAVIQEISVLNRSETAMPFGLGFHTVFLTSPGTRVRVTASDGFWSIVPPRFLPDGRLLPWGGDDRFHGGDGGMADGTTVSRQCPMTTDRIDGRDFRGAVIWRPADGIRIDYEVDAQYRHWCLWNGGGEQGFFCPEPMTWMTDAPNLNLPDDVTGMCGLEPGERRTLVSRFRVELIQGRA